MVNVFALAFMIMSDRIMQNHVHASKLLRAFQHNVINGELVRAFILRVLQVILFKIQGRFLYKITGLVLLNLPQSSKQIILYLNIIGDIFREFFFF